jgi:UDP-4-amino-4,6-dideoxy-N-acetyl-beta-L-altrosamine N-acetyltransferase
MEGIPLPNRIGLNFQCMTEKHAELLLTWRTDPNITKHMYTDIDDPCVNKQINWIQEKNKQEDYRGYVIYDDERPVGFLSFNDISLLHQRCSTGSYLYCKKARLKYAATLHTYICNYAFHRLNCNKIVNYIMGANDKVVRLNKLHGTHLIGTLRQHIFKNGKFHDVKIFEQLRNEWHSQKQHFPLQVIQQAYQDWAEE